MTNRGHEVVSNMIQPSTSRLLHGIKGTLRRIAQGGLDDAGRGSLATIEFVLNELLSRQQHGFYVSHYGGVLGLLQQGLTLASGLATPQHTLAHRVRNLPTELDSSSDFGRVSTHLSGALGCLEELITVLRADSSSAANTFRQAVTAMHQELLAQGQRGASATASSQADAPARVLTRDSFEGYVKQKFPERENLRVESFKQLTGGYQKTTILFDIVFDTAGRKGQRQSLVIRAEKDDRFVTLDAGDVCSEFEVVRLAHAAGIIVAEPMWLESDASLLGQRFFVSRKVEGDNYGTAIASDKPINDELAYEFIRTLADIHAVSLTDEIKKSPIGHWVKYRTLHESTAANVAYWTSQPWLASASPSPVLRRLKTWLEDHVPPDLEEPCFVHCDYGIHNFLVKDGKISGVLDWEAARIGDPAEDIAWCLQSSAGKIDGTLALRWYQELTGRKVSEYRLRYYDVFSTMKVMVGASCAAALYEATPGAAIEWCNIPLLWAPMMAATVEAKIAAAEAVR